jgi:hypothetical protein
MQEIPGTRIIMQGNVAVGHAVVDLEVFYQHARVTVDLAEVRRSWAENWRRRNGLDLD